MGCCHGQAGAKGSVRAGSSCGHSRLSRKLNAMKVSAKVARTVALRITRILSLSSRPVSTAADAAPILTRLRQLSLVLHLARRRAEGT